jgi:hypothetical protein
MKAKELIEQLAQFPEAEVFMETEDFCPVGLCEVEEIEFVGKDDEDNEIGKDMIKIMSIPGDF